jgi:hypothetical protein
MKHLTRHVKSDKGIDNKYRPKNGKGKAIPVTGRGGP